MPATFVGGLRGTELGAAYASADVFAFPSDTDTFGNVVLEAMASGLPVVASTVGGQVDLIDEHTGLLFAPHDIQQFRAHLERYWDDAALRSRHAMQGLRNARERTWTCQVQQLIGHYEAAMEGVARLRPAA
jgi:phosphatidylinositol alpha 1,6-mannosyltransferase